ncbi:Peroxidase 66 [Acorus gramineus]|uniref:Peroxidase n=1 Tax=Acorus gramineus TaxID=55184 RepID=A0AAV9BBB4_ACOGR|nr:Peroxidase 66 [Acorus gramineus]
MGALQPIWVVIIFTIVILKPISGFASTLEVDYYHQTCPQVESIVSETVRNATVHDPKVPARILRMFFHDCFIRGCDASVLLDSTRSNKAEKDGPPNISLRSFYVIDDAKSKLEAVCPRTVSCSDVLAIAARDVVTLSGGPYWEVLKGRKDGKISKASDTRDLPAPTFNATTLIQSFAKRGLSIKDLVALSGGHTLGFSHCSSFEGRIRNFSLTKDVDPSMDQWFAEKLRTNCHKPNKERNAGEFLDFTSAVFDNDYYGRLVRGQGVFVSDQDLYSDYRTRWMVEAFWRDQSLFFREFKDSMVRLGRVGVKGDDDGEVRIKCRVVN